jgi:hypothetical protein
VSTSVGIAFRAVFCLEFRVHLADFRQDDLDIFVGLADLPVVAPGILLKPDVNLSRLPVVDVRDPEVFHAALQK